MKGLEPVFIVLMLLGCVSPLLTFLHLWQIKEWRIDRLAEHLRHEGFLSQLFGTTRPTIALVWLIAFFAARFSDAMTVETEPMWFEAYALLFAVVSCLRIALRKQPMPVHTQKAIALFVVSFLLTFILISWSAAFLHVVDVSPRIFVALATPLLMPAIVFVAWCLLRPLDIFLKQRTMSRAMEVRKKHPNLTVIGITGSVGKTTTKELLAHILKKKDAKATPLHVNTEMGVAAWLTRILTDEPADSKRILIVEMGAYRIGEIDLLCKIAEPTIGVVTFVGRQHLGLFGSPENIAEAKGELLASLPANGKGFLNADSALADRVKNRAIAPITLVGTDAHAAVRATDIEETSKGIRFKAFETIFEVPLAGTHMVTNILLAISAARACGMEPREIAEALRTFTAFERTFAIREEHGVTILDNSYNASVESFMAAIEWAGKRSEKKKILLMDGIIELGDAEARIHREIAEQAEKVFDRVYVIGQRFLVDFKPTFKERALPALQEKEILEKGDLLVCMGRMPQSLIRSFLPNQKPVTSNQ